MLLEGSKNLYAFGFVTGDLAISPLNRSRLSGCTRRAIPLSRRVWIEKDERFSSLTAPIVVAEERRVLPVLPPTSDQDSRSLLSTVRCTSRRRRTTPGRSAKVTVRGCYAERCFQSSSAAKCRQAIASPIFSAGTFIAVIATSLIREGILFQNMGVNAWLVSRARLKNEV